MSEDEKCLKKKKMNKFDAVIEARIREKAKKTENLFYKEFEQLLYKYGFNRNVIFKGMEIYNSSEEKSDWRDLSFEVIVKNETEQFMNELSRLEYYFNGNN